MTTMQKYPRWTVLATRRQLSRELRLSIAGVCEYRYHPGGGSLLGSIEKITGASDIGEGIGDGERWAMPVSSKLRRSAGKVAEIPPDIVGVLSTQRVR